MEVLYLFTCHRPSDIRVRLRPGGQDMHFDDSGANGFELPGAAPSAGTAFKDVAYDVTIAATQTFNNGHSIDARRYDTCTRVVLGYSSINNLILPLKHLTDIEYVLE